MSVIYGSGSPYGSGYAYAPDPGAAPKRRSWDVVLTVVLLVLGLFGVITALATAAVLRSAAWGQSAWIDEELLVGDQLTLVISHLLLFAIAAVVSIPLLVTGRIAFWVPLAAGVIAVPVYWITVGGAIVAGGMAR